MCPPFYTKRCKQIVYFFCLNLMFLLFKVTLCYHHVMINNNYFWIIFHENQTFIIWNLFPFDLTIFFNLTQNTQFVDIYFKQILMYRPHKNDKTNRKQQRPRKIPNQTRVKKKQQGRSKPTEKNIEFQALVKHGKNPKRMITSLHVLDKKKIIVKNYTSYSFTLIFFRDTANFHFHSTSLSQK